MALTDTAIRKAKPAGKPYKMADSLGLFLLVNPNGSKLWRVKYRIDGVERKLALGSYPMVRLAEAREARDAARKQVSQMIDPNAAKRQARTEASTPHLFQRPGELRRSRSPSRLGPGEPALAGHWRATAHSYVRVVIGIELGRGEHALALHPTRANKVK